MSIHQLQRQHVLAAIRDIEEKGVPTDRASRKYCLLQASHHYAPKYVLSLAVMHATGKPLLPSDHNGGDETNRRLTALGFQVIECPCGGSGVQTPSIKEAKIARVVLNGPPLGFADRDVVRKAELMLISACQNWPAGITAFFLITPGGFLTADLPSGMADHVGWDSSSSVFKRLTALAENTVKAVVTRRVLNTAKERASFLTLGIDLVSSDNSVRAELVALISLKDGAIVRWTGKSYPTPGQENCLIQVTDLKTHCVKVNDERVLLLGCHDLNMFSPRGRAAQAIHGIRRKRCNAMQRLVADFRPTVILQHPHWTDSERIWSLPWSALTKMTHVKDWASGICFYQDGRVRSDLARVLAGTRSEGSGLDFVFNTRSRTLVKPRVFVSGKALGR